MNKLYIQIFRNKKLEYINLGFIPNSVISSYYLNRYDKLRINLKFSRFLNPYCCRHETYMLNYRSASSKDIIKIHGEKVYFIQKIFIQLGINILLEISNKSDFESIKSILK